MTHRLATNYAKHYCNRTPIVKVIVENVVTCFLGTVYILFLYRPIVAHGYNCRIPVCANFYRRKQTFPNVQISDYVYNLISLCAKYAPPQTQPRLGPAELLN